MTQNCTEMAVRDTPATLNRFLVRSVGLFFKQTSVLCMRTVRFFLFVALFSTLASAEENRHHSRAHHNEGFVYCSAEAIEAFEFQVRLDMAPFGGHSTAEILRIRAASLFQEFIEVAHVRADSSGDWEESLFEEHSWFLSQSDGTPRPDDAAQEVPYSESCYIRTRVKSKFDEGVSKEKSKVSSSLKIRGVDPTTFPVPKVAAIKESMDCDVHVDLYRATYKAKIKGLDQAPTFEKFRDALEIFPLAEAFFDLPMEADLEKRDHFVTHRFSWEDLEFHNVAIECSLDLRFRNRDLAVSGNAAYLGEFSCTIEPKEIEKADADPDSILDQMRHAFVDFQSTQWAQSIFIASS